MNVSNSLPVRVCQWCAGPITGRADKKFCNSACKASHGRASAPAIDAIIEKDPTPVPAISSTTLAINKKVALPGEHKAKNRRAAKIRLDKKKDAALDRKYIEQVRWFLQYAGGSTTLQGLDEAIHAVDACARLFQRHSGLHTSAHIVRRRQADLWVVRDYMLALRECRLEGALGTMPLPWEDATIVRLNWGIQQRHYNDLWENLFADA